VKIHAAHQREIADGGLGQSWTEFRSALAEIRKQGYYRSSGELEPALGAVAVPLFNQEDECVAALALVGPVKRIGSTRDEVLLAQLHEATSAIRSALSAPAEPVGRAARMKA